MNKLIHDNIHGYIDVDPISIKIIDTLEFQRLKMISQTGVLNFVFPTANHSRFEHSLGTYYLANKMINSIKNKQPELIITDNVVLIVKIAGLTHDLGHVMFSHLFDDLFLTKLKKDNKLSIHENRSIMLLDYIVKKYNIELSANQVKIIGDLINPKNANYESWEDEYKVGKWIFEIISNDFSYIDVDKMDYLTRDSKAVGLQYNFDFSRTIEQAKVFIGIDNKLHIHYPTKVAADIYDIFTIRRRLHRRIYNHKSVKAIELLIIDILEILEEKYNISNWINNPNDIIKLTDSYIWHNLDDPKIKDLFEKIVTRKFPKMIEEYIRFDRFLSNQELIEMKKYTEESNKKIIRFKVGFCGNKNINPLEKIPFYDFKKNKVIDWKLSNYNIFTNKNHIEFFTRVYH